MKNINTLIKVDCGNVHFPLETIQAMQFCAYAVKVVNVPNDIDSVYITVFKADGSHFPIYPLTQDGNGDWECELLPAHFPEVAEGYYELFGKSPSGANVPLGVGKIRVKPFRSGSIPIPVGDIIPVTEIADSSGVMHRIVAVNVGTAEYPDWTTQLDD